jgi:hypothetical protein
MPIANVVRVMRRVLPPHAKVSDEAKELIQECVSEFISFITGEGAAASTARPSPRRTSCGPWSASASTTTSRRSRPSSSACATPTAHAPRRGCKCNTRRRRPCRWRGCKVKRIPSRSRTPLCPQLTVTPCRFRSSITCSAASAPPWLLLTTEHHRRSPRRRPAPRTRRSRRQPLPRACRTLTSSRLNILIRSFVALSSLRRHRIVTRERHGLGLLPVLASYLSLQLIISVSKIRLLHMQPIPLFDEARKFNFQNCPPCSLL